MCRSWFFFDPNGVRRDDDDDNVRIHRSSIGDKPWYGPGVGGTLEETVETEPSTVYRKRFDRRSPSENRRGVSTCIRCGGVARFVCSGCMRTTYCSGGCREADWEQHRERCDISDPEPKKKPLELITWTVGIPSEVPFASLLSVSGSPYRSRVTNERSTRHLVFLVDSSETWDEAWAMEVEGSLLSLAYQGAEAVIKDISSIVSRAAMTKQGISRNGGLSIGISFSSGAMTGYLVVANSTWSSLGLSGERTSLGCHVPIVLTEGGIDAMVCRPSSIDRIGGSFRRAVTTSTYVVHPRWTDEILLCERKDLYSPFRMIFGPLRLLVPERTRNRLTSTFTGCDLFQQVRRW